MSIRISPDRPRERLTRLGAEHTSDAELVAVLLGTGTRGEAVEILAQRVLSTHRTRELSQVTVHGLSEIPGVGPSKAARVVAAVELGRRVLTRPLHRGLQVRSSQDVAAALRPRLARMETEQFFAIPLDARNRPLGEIRVAQGSITTCPVRPADIFRPLVLRGAVSVILAHNHPSGSTEPSAEDIALTDRLVAAGRLLGLEVLDHLILGDRGYFSFLDAGLLQRSAA
ncbi:MAG: DNA repair protein RadC [Myxococcota bacterium]